MTTLLPKDADNNPIPAIRLKEGGAHSITTSAASAKNAVAFDPKTLIVSLFATEDVYIKFGDSSVVATASDHFFPKGIYYDVAIGGDKVAQYTHLAALQASAAGTVYLSEKE